MTALLFTDGILNARTDIKAVGLTQTVLTVLWTFTFQLSVGQLGWQLPAETGSTRLRQKTICLARNSYYLTSVIANVLQPYFMNPTVRITKPLLSLLTSLIPYNLCMSCPCALTLPFVMDLFVCLGPFELLF